MSTHNIPFSIYNKRKSSKIIPNLQSRDFLGTKERAVVKESLVLKPLNSAVFCRACRQISILCLCVFVHLLIQPTVCWHI